LTGGASAPTSTRPGLLDTSVVIDIETLDPFQLGSR
jgi:hypothetical protein